MQGNDDGNTAALNEYLWQQDQPETDEHAEENRADREYENWREENES